MPQLSFDLTYFLLQQDVQSKLLATPQSQDSVVNLLTGDNFKSAMFLVFDGI